MIFKMPITPDNIFYIADRRSAAVDGRAVDYTPEQLVDVMFTFDVSASEAREIIEVGLAPDCSIGAVVVGFTRKG